MTAKELRNEWFKVDLIRGIPMSYKGTKLVFNTVYMRDSNMGDTDQIVSTADQSKANEEAKKLFVMVTRGIVSEAYKLEDAELVEHNSDIRKQIRRLERKIANATDELAKESAQKRIEELKGELVNLDRPFMAVDEPITFVQECFKSKDMKTADFIRLSKAFKEVSSLEEEEIEDFLSGPGINPGSSQI